MPLEQLLASLPPEILKEEPHLPESMEAEEEDSSSQIKVSSVDETMRSSSAEEGLDSKLRPKRRYHLNACISYWYAQLRYVQATPHS